MWNIGIIGSGTMGKIIAERMKLSPSVATVRSTRRGEDNLDLTKRSDIIFLCTKPAQIEPIATQIAPFATDRTVVCIAAGVSLQKLHEWLGETTAIVRAMPNTPSRIGEGITLLSARPEIDETRLAVVHTLFESLGIVVPIPETSMVAGTALSGCGPAYVYEIIEALCDGAVKLGLSRTLARVLATQTLIGAAKTVAGSTQHPSALRDEVATPGGCTIDALLSLGESGVAAGLARAVIAAGTIT